MHEQIQGIVPPMVTPFRPDGSIGEAALLAIMTKTLLATLIHSWMCLSLSPGALVRHSHGAEFHVRQFLTAAGVSPVETGLPSALKTSTLIQQSSRPPSIFCGGVRAPTVSTN